MELGGTHVQKSREACRPLLVLPLSDQSHQDQSHQDECQKDVVGALIVPSIQPSPGLPIPVQPGDLRRQNFLGFLSRKTYAQGILEKGGLAISALQAGSRIYQLVVDVKGVPILNGVNQLKSLILDSWIVTSNGLSSSAGRLRPDEAVVRMLLMLLIKRVIGIKQLGPVREVLSILNFISLASASMNTLQINNDIALTLAEIASLPGLFYTALARIIVDQKAKPWFEQHNTQELRQEATGLNLSGGAKGAQGLLGKNGVKLKNRWNAILEENNDLKYYVKRHAIRDSSKASDVIKEFVKHVIAR